MKFTKLDYCQYLLSSQVNYTITNLAEHLKSISHDAINSYWLSNSNAGYSYDISLSYILLLSNPVPPIVCASCVSPNTNKSYANPKCS
jgi:hypothetical protein